MAEYGIYVNECPEHGIEIAVVPAEMVVDLTDRRFFGFLEKTDDGDFGGSFDFDRWETITDRDDWN